MKHIFSTIKMMMAVAALGFSSLALAEVEVLDFDEFADGQIIDDEYFAELGVTISSVNYNNTSGGAPYYNTDSSNDIYDRQVAFDTNNVDSSDNDLEFANLSSATPYEPLYIDGITYATTPGNVLILQENDTGCADEICDDPDDEGARAAGYFTFTFDDPVTILSLDFFDIEDATNQDDIYYTIYFYDSDDNLISSQLIPTMEDSEWARQTYNIANVASIVLNMPGSGAIDNLAYRTAEVPTPHAAIVFALGLVGMYIRRRR